MPGAAGGGQVAPAKRGKCATQSNYGYDVARRAKGARTNSTPTPSKRNPWNPHQHHHPRGNRPPRAVQFYRDGLGLPLYDENNDPIAFFKTTGTWLALYPRDALAEDIGIPTQGTGFPNVTLANNVTTTDQVDTLIKTADDAGTTLFNPTQKNFRRGYTIYITDPKTTHRKSPTTPTSPSSDGPSTISINHTTVSKFHHTAWRDTAKYRI